MVKKWQSNGIFIRKAIMSIIKKMCFVSMGLILIKGKGNSLWNH